MDKVFTNHEFIADLIKETRPCNVDQIEYNISPLGLVEVRLNFHIPQETLDKLLKVWYNDANR